METSSREIPRVLIVKADRVYGEALRGMTLGVYPDARITIVHCVKSAIEASEAGEFDLLLTGVGSGLKADAIDFLTSCRTGRMRKVKTLVVSTHLEQRVIIALRELAVPGVFDAAADEPTQFQFALQSVMEGRTYWTPGLLRRVGDTPETLASPFRVLTTSEQMILSIVGDGSDDEMAARTLGLSPSTVSTVRRQLHRKLGVQHRGALIRIAAQTGFVRFTETGVVRPGFALLTAAYGACRRRRVPSEAAA